MKTTKPEFHLTGTLDFPNAYHYAPALGDLNNDGLDDLLILTEMEPLNFYPEPGAEE